jgi:hypothetical protein
MLVGTTTVSQLPGRCEILTDEVLPIEGGGKGGRKREGRGEGEGREGGGGERVFPPVP